MIKTKLIFTCSHCDAQYNKWQGQCLECGKWNTIAEEMTLANPKSENPRMAGFSGVLSEITPIANVKIETQARIKTGLDEFDLILGGGLVSDSAVLIGGDPGVGKSTILLQILSYISKTHRPLYVTGEESLQQLALRAKRLGLPQDNLSLLAETNVEKIIISAEKFQPKIMVIDSIQTIYTDLIPSAPGGVSQVRESAAKLVMYAKQKGIALFIVGHVTKDGMIAGPRVLEHMVDAVLYFEGQSDSRFRVIRAVKNRFGAVNEIGIFAMMDNGLKPVSNPSAIFLSAHQAATPGSVITVTWEGSRPLLVEVQALVDESHLANPRRVTVGLDHNRLSMLLAVLHRHAGIISYNQDVFVNVVGGLRVMETAADLAQVLAVISSLKNKNIPSDLIVFGEVGLSGEIRPVVNGQERIREAAKHGFKKAIIPKSNAPKNAITGIEIVAVERLQQALQCL
ncbi:MAG: DNA repair protein RadA [Gammaproteobacteria bacterium RIFCSPLOWO2_02_FULL_42_14]|nr:MAG: DNA repair protein RadA [Gammaproteobacteria bacterium RIFCSPHIGHO2_02_FULL_42_43]OGT53072.1 MAG: DNA repair protein RadA [Gammaproteobacteria bacterium RIFCSPHIGHO2_12_FULL_41_25]OGT61370.1 MAG: DNA repair protein RadA [Gammaproteobacteria bacterium RIFCSPLOWO2_02_FULL_42_14]OGT87298.1 MAG: DNA repair protein RadA [Gammaproteobacteria bacterium RIFCSPLOWO2_12_FULL_42_18]